MHEPLQAGAGLAVGDGRADLLRLAVLGPDDDNLLRLLVPAVTVHVLVLAADVRLVNLDRAGESGIVSRDQGGPQPVREMPRALLRDTQLAVQLHRADTLEVHGHQVARDGPHLEAELAGLHDSPRPHAEALAAILLATAVRHRLVLRANQHVGGAAVVAGNAIGPASLDEPVLSSLVVREEPEQLDQADTVAVVTSGGFRRRHDVYSIVPNGSEVKYEWALWYIIPAARSRASVSENQLWYRT